MWAFVERRFGLTGGSAHRRLTAAALVRRFPVILGRVEQGDILLESLCALKDVLTEENVDDLMAATAKKTLREVLHIVACLAPKPDVVASIRKLPQKAPPPSAPTPSAPVQTDAPGSLFAPATAPRSEPARERPRVEQLSEARHKVQVTVSRATREKLERARDLMKHRNPSGDLEVVFDRAMDALLEKLEKERHATTSRPQKVARTSKPGEVPAAVRREVFARDGEACTYVDALGTRCGSSALVELDHRIPRARGGADAASNLRVRCRAHNRLAAEKAFGRDYVASRIAGSQSCAARQRRDGPDFRSGSARARPRVRGMQPMTALARTRPGRALRPSAQATRTLPSHRHNAQARDAALITGQCEASPARAHAMHATPTTTPATPHRASADMTNHERWRGTGCTPCSTAWRAATMRVFRDRPPVRLDSEG